MDEIIDRRFVIRGAGLWDGVSRDTVSRSLMSIEREPANLTGTPKQGARHNVKNATRSQSPVLASFAFPRFRPFSVQIPLRLSIWYLGFGPWDFLRV